MSGPRRNTPFDFDAFYEEFSAWDAIVDPLLSDAILSLDALERHELLAAVILLLAKANRGEWMAGEELAIALEIGHVEAAGLMATLDNFGLFDLERGATQ